MFDFIKGLFVWLVKKILYVFFPLVSGILFLLENFSDTFKSIMDYLSNWISWYFQDFYIWLFNQISAEFSTIFSNHSFAVSVVEFSNDFFLKANVFLPLNEACACLSFLVATMVTVFLLRLALKAIPTIW